MTRRKPKKKYVQTSFLPQYIVSVIIPVYRRIDLLKKCVASIPEAFGDIPFEIIIMDNGTPKEEKDVYPEWKKLSNVKICESPTNIGFPAACNTGEKYATAPLLLFLNSDVEMKAESGKYLVQAMDDPTVGVVGMKLLFPDTTDLNKQIRPAGKVQHVGLVTNVRAEFVHIFSGWRASHPRVLAIRDMYAVTGAALMTRRKLFQKADGFFEEYKLGTYEDVDYCMTLREMGYNIIVENKAIGTHHTGATAEKYQIPYPLSQNRLIFVQRWGAKLQYTDWKYL